MKDLKQQVVGCWNNAARSLFRDLLGAFAPSLGLFMLLEARK